MKKKVLVMLMSGMMCISTLTACGTSNTSTKEESTTQTETSTQEETETIKEDILTEEIENSEIAETESQETETSEPKESKATPEPTKEAAHTTETKKTDEAKPTEAQPKESKPEPTKPTEPTPAPHSHSYSSSITQNASCNANGVKTFTCSCGDSYTESIPMTDHNWVAQTETIHHEASGHYEDRVTGYDRVKYAKCHCGFKAYDNATIKAHDAKCGMNITTGFEETPITESVWVEDSQAWDETKTTGYTCGSCGATK